MTSTILEARAQRIAVVDDNEDQRESWRDSLEDNGYVPAIIEDEFLSAEDLIAAIVNNAEAAICDHDLRPGNLAPVLGAEVVASLYQKKFPALLVTAYTKSDIDSIRPYRRFIPILLTPDQVNQGMSEGLITESLQRCREEFEGQFKPNRKPRFTLLRIIRTDLEQKPPSIEVVVTSWFSGEAVRLPLSMLPEELHAHAQVGERFYAWVNIGAQSQEELFFDQFEYRGRSKGDDLP